MRDLKNLQAELNTIQAEKQSTQAQLEPLQEKVEKMLTGIDVTKGDIQKIILEIEELMKKHIIAQTVEPVAEKST